MKRTRLEDGKLLEVTTTAPPASVRVDLLDGKAETEGDETRPRRKLTTTRSMCDMCTGLQKLGSRLGECFNLDRRVMEMDGGLYCFR